MRLRHGSSPLGSTCSSNESWPLLSKDEDAKMYSPHHHKSNKASVSMKTFRYYTPQTSAITAIENPANVFVVSARPYGQRAVLKFTRYITGKCCSRSVFQSPTAMLHEFSMIQIQSAK